LLETYLRLSGAYAGQLVEQISLHNKLEEIARYVQKQPKEQRKPELHAKLKEVEIKHPISLPLDYRFAVSGIRIEKCKCMDSKKKPLWLVFENPDSEARPVSIIFKVGDDIRQDALTLQLMRIMDSFWKKQNMDFRMQLYQCVSTGNMVGMLECVLDSATTEEISNEMGGFSAIRDDKTISEWLKKYNTTEEERKEAIANFAFSCAAYCVATYIIGVGDRHSDNIMVSHKGHFFHIDFGHFLGNVKKKFGVKRERSAFKFTNQYAHVVGGKGSPGYKQFIEIAGSAYSVIFLRKSLIITLFGLMLSTGIPELRSKKDLRYLEEKAFFGTQDLDLATKKFEDLFDDCLKHWSQVLNDIFHHMAH